MSPHFCYCFQFIVSKPLHKRTFQRLKEPYCLIVEKLTWNDYTRTQCSPIYYDDTEHSLSYFSWLTKWFVSRQQVPSFFPRSVWNKLCVWVKNNSKGKITCSSNLNADRKKFITAKAVWTFFYLWWVTSACLFSATNLSEITTWVTTLLYNWLVLINKFWFLFV